MQSKILNREAIEAVEEARERIKSGKFVTDAQAHKRLEL